MALYADRVKDSTSLTGTGAVTLSGTAPTGFQSFATAFGASPVTVAYCIADQTGNNWEVGTGVFNGTTGLTRVTVLGSSNGGSLVNFTGGTQDVFCTIPANYINTPVAQAQLLGFTSTLTTAALSITGASGASGTATLTFALQGSAPYAINSYIVVAGVGNTGYNGLYQVTACTTTSVSYLNATTAASSGGTVVAPVLLTKDSSVYQLIAATSTQSAFVLPDVTTLQPGWLFKIINGTSNSVLMQVYTFGGTNIVSAQQNTGYNFTCISASANDATGWRLGVSEVYSGVSGTQTTGSGSMVLSVSPTITGTMSFTGTSTSNAFFGTAQTTGQMQIGGTGQTGLIRLGQSTASQPIQIGSGVTTTATTASGTASSISSTTLTVGGTVTGTFSIGMTLSGTNVLPGTYITAGSGTSWTVNQTQTVTSTTITGTTQKSIDIGINGASGSITAITLGSATTGATSTITVNGTLRLKGYTVSTLPAAGIAGRIAYVTDATAPSYNDTLTGGGTTTIPVFDNGTAWTAH